MKSRVLPGGIKKGGEERENHRNVFFVATTSRTKCNLSGCIERKKGKEKTTKHPMEEITDVHIQETPTETVNKKKKNDKYLKVKKKEPQNYPLKIELEVFERKINK